VHDKIQHPRHYPETKLSRVVSLLLRRTVLQVVIGWSILNKAVRMNGQKQTLFTGHKDLVLLHVIYKITRRHKPEDHNRHFCL
jgi:hypothetical protein